MSSPIFFSSLVSKTPPYCSILWQNHSVFTNPLSRISSAISLTSARTPKGIGPILVAKVLSFYKEVLVGHINTKIVVCAIGGSKTHLNSWSHLLLEEGVNHTSKHVVNHGLLFLETFDLEEVLVMVIAQPSSLSSRIVSLICRTAVKLRTPV